MPMARIRLDLAWVLGICAADCDGVTKEGLDVNSSLLARGRRRRGGGGGVGIGKG